MSKKQPSDALSTRARNVLDKPEDCFVNRLGPLCTPVSEMSPEQLMRLKNCGKKTAAEIYDHFHPRVHVNDEKRKGKR